MNSKDAKIFNLGGQTLLRLLAKFKIFTNVKKVKFTLGQKNRKLRRFWLTLKKSKQTKILSTEGTSAPHRGPTRTENVFRSAGKCKSAPRAFFQAVCACCPVCITSFGIKKGMGRKSILEKNFKFLVYL